MGFYLSEIPDKGVSPKYGCLLEYKRLYDSRVMESESV